MVWLGGKSKSEGNHGSPMVCWPHHMPGSVSMDLPQVLDLSFMPPKCICLSQVRDVGAKASFFLLWMLGFDVCSSSSPSHAASMGQQQHIHFPCAYYGVVPD